MVILPQDSAKLAYIYLLIDPRTKHPFYIGRTYSPTARLTAHIGDGREYPIIDDGTKKGIIRGILEDGLSPIMRIIEITTTKYQIHREYFWWLGLVRRGYRVVNVVAKPSGFDSDDNSVELTDDQIHEKIKSIESRKDRYFFVTKMLEMMDSKDVTPEFIKSMKVYVLKGA